MRVIENKVYGDIEAIWYDGSISLEQEDCEIAIDKQGAKQLIKVLEEFVNE